MPELPEWAKGWGGRWLYVPEFQVMVYEFPSKVKVVVGDRSLSIESSGETVFIPCPLPGATRNLAETLAAYLEGKDPIAELRQQNEDLLNTASVDVDRALLAENVVLQAKVERLEKVAEQAAQFAPFKVYEADEFLDRDAVKVFGQYIFAQDAPELYAYLKEKESNG